MNHRIIVTGTDTGIGKTVFSAGLTALLNGVYWKPIQAGIEEETDSEIVLRLTGLPPDRFIPEAWRLRTPASPHLAALLDSNPIDPDGLVPPMTERPLVIEGAGGLLVPLTRSTLFVDVFARWRAPVVVCARTVLGTINHTLLSIEALHRRSIPILGVAFIGDEHRENQNIIAELGRVTILGRLPRLDPLNADTLRTEFHGAFCTESFLQGTSWHE